MRSKAVTQSLQLLAGPFGSNATRVFSTKRMSKLSTCSLPLGDKFRITKMLINVDGSKRFQPEGSSCGGVIRDSYGNWVMGFSKRLGKGDAFYAEAWGCVLDSAMVYQFLTVNCYKNHPLSGLYLEVRNLLSKDYEVPSARRVVG
ncbi:Polynucleotidyl transferase, ribonuclease H-like superfamily protein [Senna tora]|uniref:Polynucleotidyl transferase, ribonuclease H-like superfamily protein n=1 Tax=Senna tora TaxID=362788 RepID=A0A834WG26_9FABA|nr:Polynucleotidyl transferase, ribonuclease H-like superfamily protein [Senna tora]